MSKFEKIKSSCQCNNKQNKKIHKLKLFIILLIIIFILEYILKIFIEKYRKVKWLITDINLIQKFNKKKFQNFKKNSYDYFLGWDNKKSNFDRIGTKKINYMISPFGYRKTSYKKYPNKIKTFGDSYNFCRQVNDGDTWQEFLSKEQKIFVSNFGVGNYGLDQAFLKYKKTKKNKFEKIIIFCFVPETICRIQSSWKNYIEFGNLHAFKPYCALKKGKLIIKKNPLNSKDKFKDLKKVINITKANDRFYKEKFLKHYLKFPFIFNILKNFSFNFSLFFEILKNRNIKDLEVLNNKVFPIVMKKNIINSHNLYNENKSKKIFFSLINKINKDVSKDKKKCLFLVIPQLFDLELSSRSNYEKFFKSLGKRIDIIDTTKKFMNLNDFKKMYINDKYGGHLNKRGNKFIASIIKKHLNKNENYFKIIK